MALSNYKSKLLSALIGLVFFTCVDAQDFSLSNATFTNNDGEIKNALAGGLNSPQFNAIDINWDGLEDILVFDRVGNVILPFINKTDIAGEINYEFDPSYKSMFSGIRDWIRIRDLNGDMIPDLFSAGLIPGIEIRMGKVVDGKLEFEKRVFNQGSEDVIYYQLNNGSWTQIFVTNGDIPEIIDVDQDGDLDILSFEPNGGSYVYFWSNKAIEQGVSLDSFYFENEDLCFGKFKESGVDQSIFLSDDDEQCASGFWNNEAEVRHDGSTITALDKNEDGLWDVLIGDLTSSNLVYLQNGGSLENNWMTELDDNFPRSDVMVDINTFNAAYYLDVDHDGRKDIIVSPNYRTANSENFNSAWFYRDLSTSGEADFALQTENFFIHEMIDMGAGSNPAFTDYNADGLMDLVVGSIGFYDPLGTKAARLYLFENTGTLLQPQFKLVDMDYLNFSEFNSTSNNYAPTFGDMDNDGDHDLLIGDNKGLLYYLENTAGENQVYSFAAPIYDYMGIDIGENSKPQIIDLNQDGLNDIVIGERNGNPGPNDLNYAINYFQNIGSEGNPMFDNIVENSPNNPVLGIVNTRDFGFSTPSTSPHFLYLPEEEDFILLCGSESGRIKVYNDIIENFDGEFVKSDDEYGGFFEGRRTSLALADIDGDGLLEVAIGNERGGIGLYNTPIVLDSSVPVEDILLDSEISLFPNPATNFATIKMEEFKGDRIPYRMTNVFGQIIESGSIQSSETMIDLSRLQEGIYFLTINLGANNVVKKLIVSE